MKYFKKTYLLTCSVLLYISYTKLGPLNIIPVDWAGPVTGVNSALGSYEKFLPGFRDEERSKILGTSSGTKLENKVNMAKYKNFNFRAYHSFGNSKICNTAVKWDAYDVENTAGNVRRCHPDRQNSMILPFRMMKCL